ncbi:MULTISPECIES: type I DNA topoisomerase [Butyricimonas]|jgi:DNA topoisomerase-1|uniref:DNA topoisomerase 1 n=1 Tax=Butyricimonas faecihominis TaxID=1472416 RepID=A0A7W6HWI7_9BACT|nr:MULTISPECIES: type I DNA topoisomerase [Butyricimonas]MBS6688283.1 type I DNA topoisomerase [Sanguibacteroides justesenii]KAB1506190.1 type I DNA topoisomerase [Butyricimonas faecihominis]MBB4026244.1 DNA topoisomerase-1 [Butyricimonas faecihominis]WOF09558.1 type I DNA topoisomerase [Butyricimonas faecihominis]BEI58141.1 type I DNA topoisomerase [Butyricimonas faecihominis]
MIENLVIVESPAKAKTIERFLGENYVVKSSFGHIRDLEKKDLGIDIEHNFQPKYEISPDKKAIVKELKQLAKEAKTVWLASDEDREGEAIAWHLFEVLGLKKENTKRIVFHEITKDAILHAINNPRDIDKNLVDAQQARRVLDRLVGFEVSPVLWKKVKPSLSAGRVQSVAVKLIVEREREINHFVEQKYYKVTGTFETKDANGNSVPLKAELSERFSTQEETVNFLEHCKKAAFSVSNVETKPGSRKPAPPFTTSTLQQEASRKLGFSVSQTMAVAQKLYEQGHITYMRTDSVNLSQLAIGAAKAVICNTLGEKYSKPRNFATKTKGAQEAHEAIRPTYMDKESISGDKNEQQLYSLIRKRTLASQMAEAELEKTTITIAITGEKHTFEAVGEVIIFDGFLKVYMESFDDEKEDDEAALLPAIHKGDQLQRSLIQALEQYTTHPPRYTEASLVKKMEALGIGRPSTYAPTITTIQNRGYILRESRDGTERQLDQIDLKGQDIKVKKISRIFGAEKKKLFPSDIGMVVTDFLSNYFTNIMDYNFTANAEDALDHIAEGEVEWQSMIGTFYQPFHANVEKTLKESERNTGARELGKDPQTGETVSVRIGRFGPMAQIGEGESVRYAGLLKGQLMETITLEEALDLFKFPRQLGEFEEKPVSVGIGRFGPYIKHNQLFVSLKKGVDDPGTITLETAIERINEKREIEKNRKIQEFENGVQILNGRFGPYITFNKVNYKIPKGKEADKLTFEETMEIIAKGGDSKKKTTKKTTKKAAPKATKKETKKKE